MRRSATPACSRTSRRSRALVPVVDHPRSLSPRGVATNPASSRARRSALARSPVARMVSPVGALDRQPAQRPLAYGGRERGHRRGERVDVVGEGQQRAAAALDVHAERRRRRAPPSRRPCAPAGGPWPGGASVPRRPLGPGQRGAVGVGGVGRGQRDRARPSRRGSRPRPRGRTTEAGRRRPAPPNWAAPSEPTK